MKIDVINFSAEKYLIFFVLAILFLINAPSPVSADEQPAKKIRVGYFYFSGFNDRDANGAFTGYAYEYLREIAKHTNWQYEFVTETQELDATGRPTGRMIPLSFADALRLLESGDLDIVGSVRKKGDREKRFAFPDYSSGTSYAVLTTRAANTGNFYSEFSNLSGMTVGVLTNSTRNQELQQFCAEHGIKNIKLINFNNLDDLLFALNQSKSVDAVLTSNLRLIQNERIITTFAPSPYYFITGKKNKELLRELNFAQEQINLNAPFLEKSLYEKYFQSSGVRSLLFTAEEIAYIRSHPIVKIAVASGYAPLEDYAGGQYNGIIADILKILESRTGFQFEYVNEENFPELIENLKNRKTDAVSVIVNDYTWGDAHGITPTKPFLTVGLSAISNKKVNDLQNSNLRLAKIRNRTINPALENRYKTIQTYDTMQECIEAVNNGDADLFFINSYCAERAAKDPIYNNTNFSSIPKFSFELSLGVSNLSDPMLLRILNKAAYTLSSTEINQCIDANTLYYRTPTNWRNLLYQYPLQALLGLLVLLSALSFSYYYLDRNRRNKNQNLILQQKNTALKSAAEKAKEASKAKSHFLSQMSHEIRTPLNAITGLTHLAKCHVNDGSGAKLLPLLNKISLSSEHLLSLINNVLDISKIENQRMKLMEETFSLENFLRGLSAIYESQANALGLSFTLRLSLTENRLRGDTLRLNQILINLLSNAFKFTPLGGEITLAVEQDPPCGGRVYTKFSISDTGIGIAEEKQTKIFETFEQETPATAQNYGGTGLGLSIVKALTELMDGKLTLKSQKNTGSIFNVEIPFPVSTEEIPRENAEYHKKTNAAKSDVINFSGKRFLLVEDNEINIEIATELLTAKGAAVDTAANGQIALDRFISAPPHTYDLILMDIQMPVMDGYEAARRIRALPERGDAGEIPIIAMTANAFLEDVRSAFAAGMNGHVAKPINLPVFYATINEVLQNSHPAS